jgi:hypothetical protein
MNDYWINGRMDSYNRLMKDRQVTDKEIAK